MWQVAIPDYEVEDSYPSLMPKSYLVYAGVKKPLYNNEMSVAIFRRDLQTGREYQIFDYKNKDDFKGVAVTSSKDGKIFAFFDGISLNLYNVGSGSYQSYSDNNTDNCHINDDYGDELFKTEMFPFDFSSSGRYLISRNKVHADYASYTFLDLVTGRCFSVNLGFPFSKGFSPREDLWLLNGYVIPLDKIYQKVSDFKYVFRLDELFDFKRFSNLEICENAYPNVRVVVNPFSDDGEKVILCVSPSLIVNDINGGNYRELVKDKDILEAVFSEDGDSVFFIYVKDGRFILSRYDLDTGNSRDVLILPFYLSSHEDAARYYFGLSWTEEGFLVITYDLTMIANMEIGLVDFQEVSRLVVLDLDNRKLIYASPILPALKILGIFR